MFGWNSSKIAVYHMKNLYYSPVCHTVFLKALIIFTRDMRAELEVPHGLTEETSLQ